MGLLKIIFFVLVGFALFINIVAFGAEKLMKNKINASARKLKNEIEGRKE